MFKSCQELLPMGYKAPYLSWGCAFAKRNSLAGIMRGARLEALYRHVLSAAFWLRGMGNSGRLLSLNPLCSSQVKSRVNPRGEYEGSAQRKQQGPTRRGWVAVMHAAAPAAL